MSTDVDNFLAHYGIKGMKWGQRKASDAPKTPIADKDKSKHRVKLEAKYLSKGRSLAEAQHLADRQIKTEKILAVVGGVAVVAALSYVATNELGKRFASVTLKEGTDLNYINALGPKGDFDRRLYTTFKKSDTDKYRGLLAKQLKKNGQLMGAEGSDKVYDTVLRTTKSIKAPSQYQAEKMYKAWVKSNGIQGAPAYKMMNRNIVFDDPTSLKFMNHLKTKGYNAILDANDQFISGYNTKKPLVVFNAASATVKKAESIIGDNIINKNYNRSMAFIYTKAAAPLVGLGVAVTAGTKASDTSQRYASANKYFAKNPDSKLTYAEVFAATKKSDLGVYKVNAKQLGG